MERETGIEPATNGLGTVSRVIDIASERAWHAMWLHFALAQVPPCDGPAQFLALNWRVATCEGHVGVAQVGGDIRQVSAGLQ